jgi:hypothetical protein
MPPARGSVAPTGGAGRTANPAPEPALLGSLGSAGPILPVAVRRAGELSTGCGLSTGGSARCRFAERKWTASARSVVGVHSLPGGDPSCPSPAVPRSVRGPRTRRTRRRKRRGPLCPASLLPRRYPSRICRRGTMSPISSRSCRPFRASAGSCATCSADAGYSPRASPWRQRRSRCQPPAATPRPVFRQAHRRRLPHRHEQQPTIRHRATWSCAHP